MSPNMPDSDGDLSGDTTIAYSFRPSAFGAPRLFRLMSDAIVWDAGRSSGRVPFARVKRVRMSFRPSAAQNYRFVTEIWGQEGPKLTIVSTSTKNMMEQECLDTSYANFATELHRRIALAGASTVFEAGIAPAIYWFGLVIYVGAGLGLAGLIVRTLQAGTWTGAGVVAVFLGMFLWNANYFRRNRPGRYQPNALPPELLPRAST